MLFVCSFILFEVLDVDGSDFPPPRRSVIALNVVETPHDIKHVPLHTLKSDSVAPIVSGSNNSARAKYQAGLSQDVSRFILPHFYPSPLTLARASLADSNADVAPFSLS